MTVVLQTPFSHAFLGIRGLYSLKRRRTSMNAHCMESQKRINPVIMDIHIWIMDIHNWIMDIRNWIMDIRNWIIYGYP